MNEPPYQLLHEELRSVKDTVGEIKTALLGDTKPGGEPGLIAQTRTNTADIDGLKSQHKAFWSFVFGICSTVAGGALLTIVINLMQR